jgi:hypothetical protein
MRSQKFQGPLFLIGMPRSGTKLLRDLLNQHSVIMIPTVETEFLPYWLKTWQDYGDLSLKENFETFYKKVVKFPYFLYQADNGSLLACEQWYDACEDFEIGTVFETLIRLDTGARKDAVWGDKSPSYIGSIQRIKSIYPDARFIHITRDVRDYVLSINKAWGKNMHRAAQRWGVDVRAAHDQIRDLGANGLELKYEVLINDAENTLMALCKFIGVDYQKAMATLDRPSENLGDTKGVVGIVKDNQQKYLTSSLQGSRLKAIEEAAYETMLVLDYVPQLARSGRSVPVPLMRVYQLLDGVALVRSKIKERGLLGAVAFQLSYFRVTANRQR